MRKPDMGMGARLGLAFGATGLLLALLGGISLNLLESIRVETRTYTESISPRVEAAERLEAEALYLAIAVRAYQIWPEEPRLRDAEERIASLRVALEALAALPQETGGARPIEEIGELTQGYLARVSETLEAVRLARRPGEPAVELALAREALLGPVRKLTAEEHRKAADAVARIEVAETRTRKVLVAVALAVWAVFAATALLAWRAVRGPALALVEATRRVAAGDFGAGEALAGPRGDERPMRNELSELGRAFGRMSIELREREERLGSQNEELHAQNEEIQAQGEEIQAQSEQIQAQSEELQAQNEELTAQGDEMRRVNEALGHSERRYRQLFENLSEGFALHEIVRGPDGRAVDYRLVEANPAFERATGLSRVQAIGRTVREVLPGTHAEWTERFAALVETGGPMRFESSVAPLGKHLDVIAFRPAPGQLATLFFDVSDLKRAQESIVEADRRKDEFLAVLSHELRNPLAPIRNALQLLEQANGESDRSRRAREIIQRQVGYLTRLVEDLLDVTRIGRGKIELQRTRVDLARLVAQAAEDNASILDGAGVRLDVDVPQAPVLVSADPARLSQVVGNILQNAAKFTQRGGRVAVELRERDGRAAIRVQDSGIGIAPEVLDRLFEPFVQGARTLARTQGGLGLGLALVKGLVELHGGTVRARSAGPDLGAEFMVELPLGGEGAGEQERPERTASERRAVLLVEDNVDGAETLREVLVLAGHDVQIALDGKTGVAKARELRPDVILCDLGLPDIDGYEVARRIRADPALEGTLLVALTGYTQPEDQRRAAEAGFDAHLAKPASLGDIEELLSRGAPARSRASAKGSALAAGQAPGSGR